MPQQQSCWKSHLWLLFLLAGSRQQVTKIGDQGRDGETSSWPGIAFQMKRFHQTDRGWILTRGKIAKLLPISYFSDWLISNSFGKRKEIKNLLLLWVQSFSENTGLDNSVFQNSVFKTESLSLPLVWACLGLSPNISAWIAGVMG